MPELAKHAWGTWCYIKQIERSLCKIFNQVRFNLQEVQMQVAEHDPPSAAQQESRWQVSNHSSSFYPEATPLGMCCCHVILPLLFFHAGSIMNRKYKGSESTLNTGKYEPLKNKMGGGKEDSTSTTYLSKTFCSTNFQLITTKLSHWLFWGHLF